MDHCQPSFVTAPRREPRVVTVVVPRLDLRRLEVPVLYLGLAAFWAVVLVAALGAAQ